MMFLNPHHSYPNSQTNLLKLFLSFDGITNSDFITNGVNQYSSSANLSASQGSTQIITSAAPDSTFNITNGSGTVYNRIRCVSGNVSGYKDIYGSNTNVTLSMGLCAGIYGYIGGPNNPGILGSSYQYLIAPMATYVTMSGLNVGTYDLYVYGYVDDVVDQYSKFTLYTGSNRISKSTADVSSLGNGNFPIFTEDKTYIKFSNYFTNNGSVYFDWAVALGSYYGPINAIQIVQLK